MIAALLLAVSGAAGVTLQHVRDDGGGAVEAGAPAGPAPASTSGRPVLRVGAQQLGSGLAMPSGVRLTGPATTGEDPGDYHRWQVVLDLGGVPSGTVLGEIERQLREAGFDVRVYEDEVLGVRPDGGRWQLVVAHVTDPAADPQLVLAIGSRPA